MYICQRENQRYIHVPQGAQIYITCTSGCTDVYMYIHCSGSDLRRAYGVLHVIRRLLSSSTSTISAGRRAVWCRCVDYDFDFSHPPSPLRAKSVSMLVCFCIVCARGARVTCSFSLGMCSQGGSLGRGLVGCLAMLAS